jgi:hypothetical protein
MAGVMVRRVLGWGWLAGAQVALWLGFAGQVDRYEVIGAIGGATIATGAVGIVHWARPVHGVPRAGDLVKLWRVPWDVVKGMWTICVAMWRKVTRGEEGEVVVGCYAPAGGGNRHGAEHDGARRMLMTTFVTVTPGSMVLGAIKHGRRVVVHQVVKGEATPELVKSMSGGQAEGRG